MNKPAYYLWAGALISGFVLIGCSQEAAPIAPVSDEGSPSSAQSLAKRAAAPGIEVTPVFRVSTDRPGERLTVFVFHERGGKGKKPPKGGGGGEEVCSDLNTNQAFSELPFRLASTGFPVEYHPAFEPTSVAGTALGAINGGFTAWEAAVDNAALFDFAENPDGASPPGRDFTNVVGWRLFVGRGGSFLAAAFIWSKDTEILEVDIFYNLKHKWAVNGSIDPGSTLCGEQFDVQAISTHEIGHMLGLGHVSETDDATMFGSAPKGELQKQTLTPGDADGASTVVPAAPLI